MQKALFIHELNNDIIYLELAIYLKQISNNILNNLLTLTDTNMQTC